MRRRDQSGFSLLEMMVATAIALTALMAALNREAAEVMLEIGAHACTDVSGFGLLGHLREMAAGSGVDVLVVSPGAVDTEIHARKLGPDGKLDHSGRDFSSKKQMSAPRCAELIAAAIKARKRELVMTTGGKLAVWLKPFAPGFVDKQVDKAVADFYDLD